MCIRDRGHGDDPRGECCEAEAHGRQGLAGPAYGSEDRQQGQRQEHRACGLAEAGHQGEGEQRTGAVPGMGAGPPGQDDQ